MKGQSLFEVVVAIGIAALIIVGVVSLATTSIRNSSFSRNKTLASRFSQEAIEWLRVEKDADWDIFKTNVESCDLAGSCCVEAIPSWETGSCDVAEVIPGTIFIREASFTCLDSDGTTQVLCPAAEIIETSLTTSWIDGQGTHDAKASTQFTNWRAQ